MASRPKRLIIEEGRDAARRFEDTISRVLRVSKDELARREIEYQNARRAKKLRTPKPTRL